MLASAMLLLSGALYYEWIIEPASAKEPPGADEFWETLAEIFLEAVIPAFVIGLGGGWVLMRRALAPLEKLTHAAEAMSDNHLPTELARTENGDEIDRLTMVFNGMTGRLAKSFRQIKDFTLRASHELKTPLTIMRHSVEEMLPDADGRSEEKLVSIIEEIDRLTGIVESLGLLTKADAGMVEFKDEPLSLLELIEECCVDGNFLGERLALKVHVVSRQDAVIRGDRKRLRQLLLILLDNAVKYNRPGGEVAFSISRSDGAAAFSVMNTGTEIPAEALPHVFDPFFRGDHLEEDKRDGTGLGLTIAQWIVTMHRAAITVSSSGVATEVVVTFPSERLMNNV